MKRLRRVLAIAAFSAAIEAHAGAARVRLSYRAAPGCPDETTFLAALAVQAQPFERAPRSSARIRSLDAEISRAGGEHVGRLQVREADGSTSERDVRGTTCAEVFSALTLVTALTIDTGPPPPAPPPAEEPPPPPPPAPPPHWAWSTTVRAGGFLAMTPGAAWGVEPAVEAAPPLAGHPLALQLGLVLAATPRTVIEGRSAEFLWAAARLQLGLWQLDAGPFSLRPTAGLALGLVRGRGFSIALPRDETRPWLDLEAGGRAALRLLPRFALELEGGLLVPLTRHTWVFDAPQILIHETPPAGGFVTLGVRVLLSD